MIGRLTAPDFNLNFEAISGSVPRRLRRSPGLAQDGIGGVWSGGEYVVCLGVGSLRALVR